jgi:hypothetical protein
MMKTTIANGLENNVMTAGSKTANSTALYCSRATITLL